MPDRENVHRLEREPSAFNFRDFRARYQDDVREALGETFNKLSEAQKDITLDAVCAILSEVCIDTKLNKGTFHEKVIFRFLAWINELGILEKLLEYDGENEVLPFDRATNAIPENFIHDNIENIRRILREEVSGRESQHMPLQGTRSLFHGSPDKNVIKVLKSKFKSSNEHQQEAVGTGEFEKHVGLFGIFATPGYVYQDFMDGGKLDEESSLFIFPEDVIDSEHTVIIINELSYSFLADVVSNGFEDLDDEITTKLTKAEQDKRLTLGVILEMLTYHIGLPENAYADDFSLEICVDTEEAGLPTMLIVSEEAEYYYDQALEHWPEFAEQVSIITEDVIADALASVEVADEGTEPTFSSGIARFVYYVNINKLNLADLRYRPE